MKNPILKNLCEKLEKAAELLDQSAMAGKFKVFYGEAQGAEDAAFDDSNWEERENPFTFDDLSERLLVRFTVTVPEKIAGVAPAGPLRLFTFVLGNIEVYADGRLLMKEEYWGDPRTPEVRLCDDCRPGDSWQILYRYRPNENPFTDTACTARVFADNIDGIWNEIQLMLAELTYLEFLAGSDEYIDAVNALLAPALSGVLEGKQPADTLPGSFREVRALAEPLREAAKAKRIHLVGHSHIDMNWLWTTAETRKIVLRDFKTVCDIMDENPDFTFSQSQAAVYAMCEEDDPILFSRIKERIREGRWEVTAAAWVEHDANMPGGDSMARQILYAKQYTREKLGVESQIMWAPDTFGHSANLPQLLKESRCENYFFTRCGLVEVPEHVKRHAAPDEISDAPVFWWEGADGSRVLAANDLYNGSFKPQIALRGALSAVKLGLDDSMLVYGVGDHGGAPTRRDIHWARTASRSPLFPKTVFSTTKAFFDSVRASGEAFLPVRKGEMNAIFEGCYTTHADIKKAVHDLGVRLTHAEALALMCGARSFHKELSGCWKTLLFHQFHDIYDGCAIAETYREASAGFASAFSKADAFIRKSVIPAACENAYTAVNPLPVEQRALLHLPHSGEILEKGEALSSQPEDGGRCVRVVIPPFSSVVLRLTDTVPPEACGWVRAEDDLFILDNGYYHVELMRSSGEIVTYYDKSAGRYLCLDGIRGWRQARGRLFTYVVYEEKARTMSSWTLGETLRATHLSNAAFCEVQADGALKAVIRMEHRYGGSTITTDVIFDRESPVIRFDVKADWREDADRNSVMPTLRVRFSPLIAAGGVHHEIPFGSLYRPAIEAEQPQLRWSAAVDEAGGLAVLNDCKHGIRCTGNVMELTLIRSAFDPDRHTDIGSHRFSYGLYAFGGKIAESDLLQYAAQFESAPLLFSGAFNANLPVRLKLDKNIAVTAMKPAENGNGMILRAYEAFGKNGCIKLSADKETYSVRETDLLESFSGPDGAAIPPGGLTVRFGPYEIKTFYISQP